MTMPLGAVRDTLAQAASIEQARAGLEPLAGEGIRYVEAKLYPSDRQIERFFNLSFAAPVAARKLCEAMGWERPYAVSPDVHQTIWAIRLWESDLADPYRPRISTSAPALGLWNPLSAEASGGRAARAQRWRVAGLRPVDVSC